MFPERGLFGPKQGFPDDKKKEEDMENFMAGFDDVASNDRTDSDPDVDDLITDPNDPELPEDVKKAVSAARGDLQEHEKSTGVEVEQPAEEEPDEAESGD